MPKRVSPEVEVRLAELVLEHKDWAAGRLAEKLNAEYPPAEVDGQSAVSERWVRGRLTALRDRSDYWTLRPGERDVAFVLDALAALFEPGNRLPRLTLDEVAWLRVVHAAAPHLDAPRALRVARLYLAADKLTERAWLTHALDLALAQKVEPIGDPARWAEGAASVGWYGGKED